MGGLLGGGGGGGAKGMLARPSQIILGPGLPAPPIPTSMTAALVTTSIKQATCSKHVCAEMRESHGDDSHLIRFIQKQ